jgi:hypothetical protein
VYKGEVSIFNFHMDNIMLESNQKLNGKNFIHGNNKCLQSLSTGVWSLDRLVLGKEIQSETNEDAQEKYDAKNREVHAH